MYSVASYFVKAHSKYCFFLLSFLKRKEKKKKEEKKKKQSFNSSKGKCFNFIFVTRAEG